MLDRGPNRTHVDESHFGLTIPYVIPSCCFWNMLRKILGILGTHWEITRHHEKNLGT
jgi:hypothetical protein